MTTTTGGEHSAQAVRTNLILKKMVIIEKNGD